MFKKNSNVIVLCCGFNNYDKIYQQCIKSHQDYALKFGYEYYLINKPQQASITASAWLKIPLIIKALEQNYEWVTYIDADCKINNITPRLETLLVDNKWLYMSKGFSGKINSGVIFVKNSELVKELFKKIYHYCNDDVPYAEWGENGHIIHFASQWPGLQIIDTKWNNNSCPELDDYIRHFSAGGPMRPLYSATRYEKKIRVIQNIKNVLNRKKYLPREKIHDSVEELLNLVIKQNID